MTPLTSVSPIARSSDLPTAVEPVNDDLVDARMPRQRVADGRARARDDVQDAVRQARLRRQLREPQRRERRLRRGLQHHGVAGGERRAELPGGDDQRVVPGHDRGHDPDRLAGHERERLGPVGPISP